MGNVIEDWMTKITHVENCSTKIDSGFRQYKRANAVLFSIKNILFTTFLFNDSISKLFYRWKNLPKSMLHNFNNIIPK
jgi:hypothetical protein